MHSMSRPVRLLVTLSMAATPFACRSESGAETDASGLLPFDTAYVRVVTASDTLQLVVELAVKPDQRTMGLMERRHLPDSAGMLFIYEATQPASNAFWMHRTRIPLDIAFVDSAGTIRSIQHMVPCESAIAQGCQTYPAGAPFRVALEVNAGYFARHGVEVGHRVLLQDTASHRAGGLPR
jgi:uncharacterized membrane protein (UPF0127 family)